MSFLNVFEIIVFTVFLLWMPQLTGMETDKITTEKFLSNAEKIRLIKESILKNQDAFENYVDENAVCSEIADIMKLDSIVTKETMEMERVRRQLVEQQFADEESTRQQFEKEAAEKFPLFNIGTEVEVFYLLCGRSFHVSGIFYRFNQNYVWIGSKKISRPTLSKKSCIKLFPEENSEARVKYVKEKMKEYLLRRSDYEQKLTGTEYEKKSGKLFLGNQWMTPRELIASRVKYINEEGEIERMSNRVAEGKNLKSKIAHLKNVLGIIKSRFPDHVERIMEYQKLLNSFINMHIEELVAQVKSKKDSREAILFLDYLILTYPDAENIGLAKEALRLAREDIRNKNQNILRKITHEQPQSLPPIFTQKRTNSNRYYRRRNHRVNIIVRRQRDQNRKRNQR